MDIEIEHDFFCNMPQLSRKNKKQFITALVANESGEIFELEGYSALGMAGDCIQPLTTENTIKIPYGSELMYLPDRLPVLYNINNSSIETLNKNPYAPGESIFPVAAFNSPGYVISYVSAYKNKKTTNLLPLFSYGAVGWHNDGFRTAAILVDKEPRQDLRFMKQEDVISGIEQIRKKLPNNRLCKHLEKCALQYGCPAGKNFFLKRYEAPLPTSQRCNARCLGCLSLQENNDISCSQNRISFTPSSEEIFEVAIEHITTVKNPIVSFGQGCEGDPLLAAKVIEPAIKKIRSKTSLGTININTNASRPDVVKRLFNAGLDSIRVSMNSVRKDCYHAYFRPSGYNLSHVLKSIQLAVSMKKFVSVNYLNIPGFTDSPQEFNAFTDFLTDYPINMIQWRNLNFDPINYWETMNRVDTHDFPVGIRNILRRIKKSFPDIKFGYFNPAIEP